MARHLDTWQGTLIHRMTILPDLGRDISRIIINNLVKGEYYVYLFKMLCLRGSSIKKVKTWWRLNVL